MSSDWYSSVNDHLLKSGLVDGSALIDDLGKCVYSSGCLEKALPDTFTQFQRIFKSEPEQYTRKFILFNKNFHVFYTSSTSIYAVSKRKRIGLILNHLPFGTMINVYKWPLIAQQVVPVIESLCDLLKM